MTAIEAPIYGRVYQTYPSCFQLAEKPLFAFNEFFNNFGNDKTPDFNPVEFLKQREWTRLANFLDFAPIRYTGIALAITSALVGFMAAYTLTSAFAVCATTITIPLDIVVGLCEAAHSYSLNYSSDEILRILQKKCLAYPAQQLAFVLTFVAFAGIFGVIMATYVRGVQTLRGLILFWSSFSRMEIISLLLIANSFTSYSSHRLSQTAIDHRFFPAFLKPGNSNIFINGGSVNEFGEKFADIPFSEGSEDQFYASRKQRAEERKRKKEAATGQKTEESVHPNNSAPTDEIAKIIEEWKGTFKNTKNELSQIPFAKHHVHAEFLNFYNLVMRDGVTREQLLGINPLPASKEPIQQAYKRKAMILHPDRCQGPKNVADALFKILNATRSSLEEEYDERQKASVNSI